MEANKNAVISLDKSCWDKISNECKEILLKMLQADPEKRISFEEIIHSPWIQ